MEREAYKECMRNHAATIGSYATDGCGEYTSDPTVPDKFLCAACGCHRNFHRKMVVEGGGGGSISTAMVCYSSPASSVEERGMEGKKRSRTKFTAEQKEKMLRFAEKIGWKMPRKEGSEELERFCKEVGIGRHVFKVWMHNHKNSSSSSSAN